MARKRRRFTPEFKARVALEALREGLPEVFAGTPERKAAQEHEAKIRDLHAKIGELTLGGLPASQRAVYLRLRSGFQRIAVSAGM